MYVCMIYCLKNWLFGGEEKQPQKLWRRLKREKTKLGSTVINRVSQTLFLFSFHFLYKLIFFNSISKLVTPDLRLQGCIVLYNRVREKESDQGLFIQRQIYIRGQLLRGRYILGVRGIYMYRKRGGLMVRQNRQGDKEGEIWGQGLRDGEG